MKLYAHDISGNQSYSLTSIRTVRAIQRKAFRIVRNEWTFKDIICDQEFIIYL